MSIEGLTVLRAVVVALASWTTKTIQEADRQAGQQAAGEVAEQQPLGVRQEEHHGDRGEQARVGGGDQGEEERCRTSPPTLPTLAARRRPARMSLGRGGGFQ